MREGYYTDAYFNHAPRSGRTAVIRGSWCGSFQKKHAVLGGMDEALAILKLCCDSWDDLTVHALYDGDAVEPWESVLTVEGLYTTFAHLETAYLGTLARRTLVATNTTRVLEAAGGKPIIFMAARRPPSSADWRRLRGVHRRAAGRRSDRRDLGRTGVVVGWARDRHGAARTDSRLWG